VKKERAEREAKFRYLECESQTIWIQVQCFLRFGETLQLYIWRQGLYPTWDFHLKTM